MKIHLFRSLGNLLREIAARIDALAALRQAQDDKPTTRVACDTAPLAERAFAERAGLGWIGKHTSLIVHGLGSAVFLGEIVDNSVDEFMAGFGDRLTITLNRDGSATVTDFGIVTCSGKTPAPTWMVSPTQATSTPCWIVLQGEPTLRQSLNVSSPLVVTKRVAARHAVLA